MCFTHVFVLFILQNNGAFSILQNRSCDIKTFVSRYYKIKLRSTYYLKNIFCDITKSNL